MTLKFLRTIIGKANWGAVIKHAIAKRVADVHVHEWINGSRLIFPSGCASAELQVYTGVYDKVEFDFLEKHLNQGDLFVDVGANIGVYTVYVAKVLGVETIAIEPVRRSHDVLLDNIYLNRINGKATTVNCAVTDSDENQYLWITNNKDSTNHITSDRRFDVELVYSQPLDTICESVFFFSSGKHPDIIKIDVEGYEQQVLDGASKSLVSARALIIEKGNYTIDKYRWKLYATTEKNNIYVKWGYYLSKDFVK